VEISPGLFLAANPVTGNTLGVPGGIAQAFRDAIQPTFRQQASLVNGFPVDIWKFPPTCPGGVLRPCPEAISADDPGMYAVNYRNESLTARVFDPNATGPDGLPGAQATGLRGDLAFAMQSRKDRAIPDLNTALGLAPAGYGGSGGALFLPPITQLTALSGGDPFTPTMRAFDLDRVHVKMQAGGQEEEHTFLIHGLKWLQAGSGFGEAKNSGWRNAQPGGISEQFSLRMPVFADLQQAGGASDYAYSANASLDGWVTGTWGALRSYRNNRNDLFRLPSNNPTTNILITNQQDFDGVCPKAAPVRPYDITAVLANDVLPPPDANMIRIEDLFPGAHAGIAPNSTVCVNDSDPSIIEDPVDGDCKNGFTLTNTGGTLVYNTRTTVVDAGDAQGGQGPLHDPTAILYVHSDDLEPIDFDPAEGIQPHEGCFKLAADGVTLVLDPKLPTCPVKLKDGVPAGPLVLRAAAGECVDVTLRNKLLSQAFDANGFAVFDAAGAPVFYDKGAGEQLYVMDEFGTLVPVATSSVTFDRMPDLANGNAIPAMVRRDRDDPNGMTSFNNNLMAPSAWAGLHPALVEYDVTRADGTVVGQNPQGQLASPGGTTKYQWFAGHLEEKRLIGGNPNQRRVRLDSTPIEFGGFNLMPADKVKQGQKAMLGAGVIYPQGSTWIVDSGTTTSATVTAPSGTFRDFTVVAQKGASMYYADSFPVENILGEGTFGVAEDSQDMGHMAINYGTEPMWFRFGVNPTNAAGNAGADGTLGAVVASNAYSNALAGNADPETAVFRAWAGIPFRQHVLMPFGPGRGSTFDLHGHVWQRDPYVCPGDAHLDLPGKCNMGNGLPGQPGDGSVGSQALGDNPVGFWLGGIDSWFAGEHYEVVIPMAGGANGVTGDYLFRDHMGLGNVQGLWGIVRVETAPVVESTVTTGGGGNGGGGGKKPKK
jgi:hypothetical protein